MARRGRHSDARDLIERLHHTGEEFTALWKTGDVAVRRGDRKRLNHPDRGILEVNCQNVFSEDGRHRLQFFTTAQP